MENSLVVGILDIVEDKLREFGIQIPDDEREESSDPIVGYQYAELHDKIKEYLEDKGIPLEQFNPYRNTLLAPYVSSPAPSPQPVYCLCEEHEDGTGIREFNILAVSSDQEYLRKHMQRIIANDQYGLIKENGVEYAEEDNFCTNYDCGFVSYYIEPNQVLSREDLKRSLGEEKKPSLVERINDVANRVSDHTTTIKEHGGKDGR